MTVITEIPNKDSEISQKTKDVRQSVFERFSKLGRGFWKYTEKTGETNTKPYEGWM